MDRSMATGINAVVKDMSRVCLAVASNFSGIDAPYIDRQSRTDLPFKEPP